MYRTIIENLADAILVVNPQGRILFLNNAASRWTGFHSSEDAKGWAVTDVLSPLDSVVPWSESVFQHAARKGFLGKCKTKGRGNRGAIAKVYISAAQLTDSPVYILTARDITGQDRTDECGAPSPAPDSIGTLAGGIAHDFNNLLTIIMGNIYMAKRFLTEDNNAKGKLTEAEKASMRAKELTRQILAYAEGVKPLRKPVCLGALIRHAVARAIAGSEIECNFSVPDDLPAVEADEKQIQQAVHSIMINACDAMPLGGVVNIRAESVVHWPDNLPIPDGKPYVKISIEDTGQGIPEKCLSRIFDPYFTTKEMGTRKGTGLGLSICYSIIKSHGGHIEVATSPGLGTTFHIYLPASERHVEAPASIDKAVPNCQP